MEEGQGGGSAGSFSRARRGRTGRAPLSQVEGAAAVGRGDREEFPELADERFRVVGKEEDFERDLCEGRGIELL